MSRPIGVTILAVLQLISSLIALLIGVLILLFRGFFLDSLMNNPEFQTEELMQTGMVGTIVTILGIGMVLLSLIGLLLCYGLFMLKFWAWIITLILQFMALLGNLMGVLATQMNDGNPGGIVLQLVINGVIIYYLLRRDVRRSFGQAA
ncbi:hypothetical protein [Geitlerinema sp. PCC 7407]|uniref:hypothetical protein n=1 Tax=Geitlerinema sp. PCC 7407 TaxID=1173025 RepID=UPI00029F99C7|nr:hypothetical protein [Geitlerinema sp. PCC 7407]AFY66079.1 hypothetical protein GEI7407_1588 [Geitlerinema sp. PCC 7407]